MGVEVWYAVSHGDLSMKQEEKAEVMLDMPIQTIQGESLLILL